jgi:hypothetical protein
VDGSVSEFGPVVEFVIKMIKLVVLLPQFLKIPRTALKLHGQ